MEKIRFDVVGLSHWGVRDCWKEYAAKAVGRQLTIQPQSVNLKDPYAVRAREGGLHVGYVAVSDLDVVYQALAGSGEKRLHGVVVESNPEPPVLTVECEVERVDWDYEPFDDKVYEGWKYDGLSLMPKRLELLGDWTTDLMDELEGSVANRDAIRELTGKLLESNLYDMSREMTRARYRIERLLAQCGDKELQEAARKLRQQKGMLMRHESREQIAHYLFIDQPRHLLDKRLEASHYTYDNHLDQLEQQLRAFPYQLYDKFLNDPVDFLREIYYKHVPRKFLFKLLSGIVLMILKGHVEIKKWGREGNTKPIEELQSLQRPMSTSERDDSMKRGLIELLEKKDANGKHIVSQKNQWAGIISILTFDYSVESSDLRDMCRKMSDWGFGKDSAYKNYCDYDSVSKCSEYANNAFNDWRGSGTAHQRQVRAAVELRAILRPKIGYR